MFEGFEGERLETYSMLFEISRNQLKSPKQIILGCLAPFEGEPLENHFPAGPNSTDAQDRREASNEVALEGRIAT